MNILTREQLEKLPTKRLLAYKKKFMKVPEGGCEFAGCDCNDDIIFSKSHPQWQETYLTLKSILATREHVE